MTLLSTQDLLSNKAFYVLQSPVEGLFWGSLTIDSSDSIGRFVDFNQTEFVYLGKPEKFVDLAPLEAFEKAPLDVEFSSFGKSAYEKRFKAFKSEENVQKAVLFETFEADVNLEIDAFLSFLGILLKRQKLIGGYVFGFYDSKNQRALLGLSPEYLYKTDENKKLWTTAVAGSQKVSDFKPWSDKLVQEHQMVEEGIKKSLKDEVEFSKPENLGYGELLHLSSKGQILTGVEGLSAKLHPTAAVGTLPKNLYKNLDLGPEPRGFYGGYAELKGVNLPFSLVTIRGLEWRDSKLQASIGGGVLKESTLDEEWSEVAFKWEQFQKLWN